MRLLRLLGVILETLGVLCSQLYNVVVDTETVGKKLLQHGDLRRRYTIIPLNKISARAIDDSVVRRAQNLVSNTIFCVEIE